MQAGLAVEVAQQGVDVEAAEVAQHLEGGRPPTNGGPVQHRAAAGVLLVQARSALDEKAECGHIAASYGNHGRGATGSVLFLDAVLSGIGWFGC